MGYLCLVVVVAGCGWFVVFGCCFVCCVVLDYLIAGLLFCGVMLVICFGYLVAFGCGSCLFLWRVLWFEFRCLEIR